MRKGDMPVGRRTRPNRTEAFSELPLVAILLVAAVLIAALAAGGPVLHVLFEIEAFAG